ncbi:hypothetical protein QYE76_042086 [Lolium multiflorum]|uniref:Uncharacterized protein n=1 Tax=Lolium multiflorum TaxID=4521 RepID=A0AAD8TFZ9_LOLMU|nr:hypothetical protein QYE76_042086 [Lolium multiflorum]
MGQPSPSACVDPKPAPGSMDQPSLSACVDPKPAPVSMEQPCPSAWVDPQPAPGSLDQPSPSACVDPQPAPGSMEQPSPRTCVDPKQQLSCERRPEDSPVEGTERAAATLPGPHPRGAAPSVQIQDPSVASPICTLEPSANPLEKIRDPHLQLLSPSSHSSPQVVPPSSSLTGSAVGPPPSSLLQNTGMMPETYEQSLKILQEQIQSLTVKVTNLSHSNKKLKDQLAAAEHMLNLKGDVKDGEQDDLISKLRRCHDYICCENEQVRTQLRDLVKHEVLVDSVQAPGSELPQGNLTPLAKLLCIGMVDDVYRLHLEGITLDGKLSIDDFYWTSNKKVKLGREVRERALLKSDESTNLDYNALSESINDLFKAAIQKGVKLPVDFQSLQRLMKSENPDPNSKKGLIRYNMSLMDGIAQKNHFLTMYSRFDQLLEEEKHILNKSDLPKSEIVLSYIIAAEDDWPRTLQNNSFVLKAHTKNSRDKGFTPELKCGSIQSRKVLLEKWRHNLTHLHEHSVVLGKVQFYDIHQAQMLESCTPGVFVQFQEGMNAIGELEYPHLVAALKA